MRKTLTGLGMAFFLVLTPVANASADAPVVQSQATPSPQPTDTARNDGGGNGGLWGLLGLLGLLGLAGLRKGRNPVGTAEHMPTATGTTRTGTHTTGTNNPTRPQRP